MIVLNVGNIEDEEGGNEDKTENKEMGEIR